MTNAYKNTESDFTEKINAFIFNYDAWRNTQSYKQLQGQTGNKELTILSHFCDVFNRIISHVQTSYINIDLDDSRKSSYNSKMSSNSNCSKLVLLTIQKSKGEEIRLFSLMFKNEMPAVNDLQLFIGMENERHFMKKFQDGSSEQQNFQTQYNQLFEPATVA